MEFDGALISELCTTSPLASSEDAIGLPLHILTD